ncbi:hypothetical protein [Burkholderia sp. LMG 32019]|uniref:hypothetical protein n=1 Tax=Burkholderia sp. LMG 32019 TaxID=3158173 RepID=UPI003C2F28A5
MSKSTLQTSETPWSSYCIELYAQLDDPQLRVLKLYAITNRLNSKGRLKKDRTPIVTNLLLPPPTYEQLMVRLKSFPNAEIENITS